MRYSDYNTPNFFLGAYDRYDTWARNATTIWNLEMAVTNSGKVSISVLARLRFSSSRNAYLPTLYLLGYSAERHLKLTP